MTGPTHGSASVSGPTPGSAAVGRPVEPVVVAVGTAGTEPRRAALADVLIAPADGRPAGLRCAELLARYPGLALAVVVDNREVAVRVRDQGPLCLPYRPSPERVAHLATALYLWWAAGRSG